jgi:hypothetical protein
MERPARGDNRELHDLDDHSEFAFGGYSDAECPKPVELEASQVQAHIFN